MPNIVSHVSSAVVNFDSLPDSANVRARVVAAVCGVSEVTVYRWARQRADFPKAQRIGTQTTVWRVGAVRAFISGNAGA